MLLNKSVGIKGNGYLEEKYAQLSEKSITSSLLK